MTFFNDETIWYCPHCGEVQTTEEANVKYYPPTWGYNGGSPEEWEVLCRNCGNELYEAEKCEICGEPICFMEDGSYESSGRFCTECMEFMDNELRGAIQNIMDELGLSWNDAAEAMFDYAERKDWFKEKLQ